MTDTLAGTGPADGLSGEGGQHFGVINPLTPRVESPEEVARAGELGVAVP